MEKLSEFDINKIKDFINNNDEKKIICSSPKYIHSQSLTLELIKKYPDGYFKIFGNDGYRSYGYYKSTSNIIYLIELYLQELTSYSIIE